MTPVLGDEHPLRILVLQLWTVDPTPIETALRAVGIAATIRRADFEAALNAALAHERFDVVIFDPTTPELSRQTIDDCLRRAGCSAVPVVVVDDIASLGERVASHLRRN